MTETKEQANRKMGRGLMSADARMLLDELNQESFDGSTVREIVARMSRRLDAEDERISAAEGRE